MRATSPCFTGGGDAENMSTIHGIITVYAANTSHKLIVNCSFAVGANKFGQKEAGVEVTKNVSSTP